MKEKGERLPRLYNAIFSHQQKSAILYLLTYQNSLKIVSWGCHTGNFARMEQLVQVGAMLLRRWRVGSTRSVASGVFSPLGNDNHAAYQPNPWALLEKANEERRQAVEKANEERRQADEKALETMTLLAAANKKLAAETR